jgi:hypothetical protein
MSIKLPCEWTYDEDEDRWSGTCGVAWSLNDGSPTANKMKFCPECGRELVEASTIRNPMLREVARHIEGLEKERDALRTEKAEIYDTFREVLAFSGTGTVNVLMSAREIVNRLKTSEERVKQELPTRKTMSLALAFLRAIIRDQPCVRIGKNDDNRYCDKCPICSARSWMNDQKLRESANAVANVEVRSDGTVGEVVKLDL